MAAGPGSVDAVCPRWAHGGLFPAGIPALHRGRGSASHRGAPLSRSRMGGTPLTTTAGRAAHTSAGCTYPCRGHRGLDDGLRCSGGGCHALSYRNPLGVRHRSRLWELHPLRTTDSRPSRCPGPLVLEHVGGRAWSSDLPCHLKSGHPCSPANHPWLGDGHSLWACHDGRGPPPALFRDPGTGSRTGVHCYDHRTPDGRSSVVVAPEPDPHPVRVVGAGNSYYWRSGSLLGRRHNAFREEERNFAPTARLILKRKLSLQKGNTTTGEWKT